MEEKKRRKTCGGNKKWRHGALWAQTCWLASGEHENVCNWGEKEIKQLSGKLFLKGFQIYIRSTYLGFESIRLEGMNFIHQFLIIINYRSAGYPERQNYPLKKVEIQQGGRREDWTFGLWRSSCIKTALQIQTAWDDANATWQRFILVPP